jgi:predicted  nucleic acid-binding Zn-ribbon protein
MRFRLLWIMKRFNYIDENNKEVLDLIRLFEYAFNHTNLSDDEIIIALKKLEKYIIIKQKI